MRKAAFSGRILGITLLAGLSGPTMANMDHSSSLYGVLPSDIASAQAFSLFNTQVSSVFYNPASMARDERGELTGGLLHAEHDLEAKSQGGDDPNEDRDRTINDTPSQQVLLGMKTDISRIFTFDKPVHFGLMLGIEKFGQELVAFHSESSREPQYLRYDRQPMFLSLGLGTNIWRGLDGGISAHISLHNEAELDFFTDDLSEQTTQRERLEISTEPLVQPIAGLTLNWGETFCELEDCWLDNLDTALAFRAHTYARTHVDTRPDVDILVDDMHFTFRTIDSFQPATWSAGVKYDFGRYRLGLAVERREWSRLEKSLERDDVKTDEEGEQHVRLDDIWVPRVGVEYDLNEWIMLSGGVAYQESPLEKAEMPDVNYLDNDRVIIGLGASALFENFPLVDWPVELNFGYQYHRLDERDFELSTEEGGSPAGPHETVTADGDVHVFSGSFTVRF